MKTQGNNIKGILITGILILTLLTSYAGEDKTKKITSNKLVILVEQLNQLIKVADELELNIEKWMIKENFLNNVSSVDNTLPIEKWMLDQGCFDISDCDEELVLESWMDDPNYIITSEVPEEELKIENWMMK